MIGSKRERREGQTEEGGKMWGTASFRRGSVSLQGQTMRETNWQRVSFCREKLSCCGGVCIGSEESEETMERGPRSMEKVSRIKSLYSGGG